MRFKKLDKETDEYEKFNSSFRDAFSEHYFIEGESLNPFRTKDNIYYYIENESKELVAAINVAFLTKEAFNSMKSGLISDDMELTIEDIQEVKNGDEIFAYIATIYTIESYRGKGYAEQLLKKTIKEMLNMYSNSRIHTLALCLDNKSTQLFEKTDYEVIKLNSNKQTIVYKFFD